MSLISRAGQQCYSKSLILRKDRDVSSKSPLKVTPLPTADPEEGMHSQSHPVEPVEEPEINVYGSTPPLLQKFEEERKMSQPKENTEKQDPLKEFRKDTKTQKLRLEALKCPKPTHSRSKSHEKLTPYKAEERYKQRLDYPLKGFEFEAITRKPSQSPKKSPQTSPKRKVRHVRFSTPKKSLKRNSEEKTIKLFETAKAPIFDKLSTGRVKPQLSVNEKRFLFNPRDFDFFGRTRYCPFPTIDLRKSLSRENSVPRMRVSPGRILNIESRARGSKAMITFDKMIDRERAQFPKQEKFDCLTIDSDNIIKKHDKLSNRKRTITPNFDRVKGRYQLGQNLPSFMENLNNRLSITGLSSEMLKANRFLEMEFPSAYLINKSNTQVDYDRSKVRNRPTTSTFITNPWLMTQCEYAEIGRSIREIASRNNKR